MFTIISYRFLLTNYIFNTIIEKKNESHDKTKSVKPLLTSKSFKKIFQRRKWGFVEDKSGDVIRFHRKFGLLSELKLEN